MIYIAQQQTIKVELCGSKDVNMMYSSTYLGKISNSSMIGKRAREEGKYLNWLCVVAREQCKDEKFVGCVIGNLINRKKSIKKTTKQKRSRVLVEEMYLEIFFLHVNEEFRRMGIATRLINHVVQQCEKAHNVTIKTLRLHCLSINENGIRFYEKLGFEKIKEKVNYPKKGYTSFRYQKELL